MKGMRLLLHHIMEEIMRYEYFQNNPTTKVDPSKSLSGTALHRLEKTVQLDNDNDNDLDATESVSRTRQSEYEHGKHPRRFGLWLLKKIRKILWT